MLYSHTPTTPHRTTITSTHKPSSHKKRRGQSTTRGLTRKGHTAARQTDQEPVVSSSKGDLSSSPGIPAARTVFSPSSEALASHVSIAVCVAVKSLNSNQIADIVSGVRTTPVSFLPSHLTYATPQSPSGRERPLIARFLLCPLSPLQRHLCRRTRFNGHRYHQHMLLVPRNTVSLPLLAHHSRSPAHSNKLPQSLLPHSESPVHVITLPRCLLLPRLQSHSLLQ